MALPLLIADNHVAAAPCCLLQVDPVVFNMLQEDPGKVDYSSIGGLSEQIRWGGCRCGCAGGGDKMESRG